MAKRTSPTQRHTEAAQILYRMANKVGAGPNRTVNYAIEPITPVTPGHGGFYMLQSGANVNHNPAYSTASFNQNVGSISVSGGQLINSIPPHSVIPLYIPSGGTTTTTTHIKQEPGLLQFQNLQNLHQAGTRLLLTAGPPGEGVPLYQGARMANGTLIMNPQSDSPGPSGSLTGSTGTKGRGGRKAARDDKLTPEEEERRKVRRERNKQAAARCRKRRMDHTNVLVEEVEGLEEAGNQIKADIEEMQREKEEIEYLLQNHRATCSKEFELPPPPAVVETDVEMEESAAPVPQNPETAMPPPPPATTVPLIHVTPDKAPEKKSGGATRPASLPVQRTLPSGNLLDLAMPTPSPTKLFFNFDHSGLTPTGLTPTGLTPLIPSCSTDTPQNKSPPRPVDAAGESVSPNLVSL